MELMDLLEYVNDNVVIDIYASSGALINTYDGKDNIPYQYQDYEVSDIFVDKGKLCMEINIEPDTDYEE